MDLRLVHKRWHASSLSDPFFLIDRILELADGFSNFPRASSFPIDKAHILLALLCGDIIASPGDLVVLSTAGNDARSKYSQALVVLAQALLHKRPLGRVVETGIVNELTLLSTQYPAIGEGTDVWVSFVL